MALSESDRELLARLDATAQAEIVRSGDATPSELVDAAIDRIERVNPQLNAVIHPLFERARDRAQHLADPDAPFFGVPMLVKDLDGFLAGAPWHGGNRVLKEIDWHPERTSYHFTKFEQAGFVIVGKTNTPEFGLMPSTEPLAYGPTHNTWNPAHSPGGEALRAARGPAPRRAPWRCGLRTATSRGRTGSRSLRGA